MDQSEPIFTYHETSRHVLLRFPHRMSQRNYYRGSRYGGIWCLLGNLTDYRFISSNMHDYVTSYWVTTLTGLEI